MEIQPGTLQSVKSAAGDPVLRLLLLIKTGFSLLVEEGKLKRNSRSNGVIIDFIINPMDL